MSIIYYQIPFLRCSELDLLSGLVISFCVYIVVKPYFGSDAKKQPTEEKMESMEEKTASVEEEKVPTEENATSTEEKVPTEENAASTEEQKAPVEKTGFIEEEATSVEKTEFIEENVTSATEKIEPAEEKTQPKRIVYSVEFIRNLRAPPEADRPYSIITKVKSYGRHSPTPFAATHGKSRDPFNYFRHHTPEVEECITRSPRGRLNAEEERDYEQSMRECTPDFCHIPIESLPKDVHMGRVFWLKKSNGRIHVQQPINGLRDIFFHLHDCELEEGDTIQLGDSVMFELSLYEGRLCAVKVKKMATKIIPSPDFSRRMMKRSQENMANVEELTLH